MVEAAFVYGRAVQRVAGLGRHRPDGLGGRHGGAQGGQGGRGDRGQQGVVLAAEKGDLQNITGGQNNAAASQLNRVLSDPEAAKKLLSTPAAQKLFEALGGKK